DLFSQLGLAVGRDLPAEHDQVERSRVEPAGDVAEVVGRLDVVAELAQASRRVVENKLALADQQHAELGIVAAHLSSFAVVAFGGRPSASVTDGPILAHPMLAQPIYQIVGGPHKLLGSPLVPEQPARHRSGPSRIRDRPTWLISRTYARSHALLNDSF